MPRRVDQVKGVKLAVGGGIGQADGLAFDGDAPFAFDIHVVQDLIFEITIRDNMGGLDQAIGEGGLAVIDMGDDTEIANLVHMI